MRPFAEIAELGVLLGGSSVNNFCFSCSRESDEYDDDIAIMLVAELRRGGVLWAVEDMLFACLGLRPQW